MSKKLGEYRYLYEYRESARLSDVSFYSLIMAAMRQADSHNTDKLMNMYPEIWEELKELFNTPGALE